MTAIVVLILLGIKYFFCNFLSEKNNFYKFDIFVGIVMFSLTIIGFYNKNYNIIQLYPVVLNISFAAYFIHSTLNGNTPIIEKIARIKEKNLPKQAIVYTRNVTKVWASFFLVNASISVITLIFFDLNIWTIYNSVISYIFIGIIFLIEYCIRIKLRRSWNLKTN